MKNKNKLTFIIVLIIVGLLWGHLHTNSQLSKLRVNSEVFTTKLSGVSSVSNNNQKALMNLDEIYLEQQKLLTKRLRELEYRIEAQAKAHLTLADENQQFRQFIIKTCSFVAKTEEYEKHLSSECAAFISQLHDCSGRSFNDLMQNNNDTGQKHEPEDNYNLFRCEH